MSDGTAEESAARERGVIALPTNGSSRQSDIALRSMIWRVVIWFAAGIAVVVAFAIAWSVGAFAAHPDHGYVAPSAPAPAPARD